LAPEFWGPPSLWRNKPGTLKGWLTIVHKGSLRERVRVAFKKEIADVRAVGDHTVEFILSEPETCYATT